MLAIILATIFAALQHEGRQPRQSLPCGISPNGGGRGGRFAIQQRCARFSPAAGGVTNWGKQA